jgi:ABC-type transport system involved in multi-copper enzyme maturation permease subunit
MMNPVLQKDLLSLLRMRRLGAVQVLFVLVLGTLVLATWPRQGVVSIASQGQDALLLGLVLAQLVMLILIVPGVAAVSITSEREQGTFEMLYASRLSATQLILGKLLCAIAYPLLLLLSGLPFLALLYYRGSVDLSALSQAYVVLVLSAVLLAVVSLAISAICRQSATALVASYGVVMAMCGAVLVPAAIMLASQGGLIAQVLHNLRGISPVAAILSILRPKLNEFGGRAGGSDSLTGETFAPLMSSWQIFVPVASAVIVICLLVLVQILRRPALSQETRRSDNARDQASPGMARRVLFLIDPNRQRQPIRIGNPVMAKESRTSSLASGRWMIRIFYGALVVSIGLALMAMYGGQTEHGDLLRYVAAVLVAFQIGLIGLINPSLTASAIGSEVEAGTFELLRLSPLRSGQVFWGKFLPAFLPALLPIIALLPAYGAICFVNQAYLHSFLLLLPVVVALVALCCASGLMCSAFLGNTTQATLTNYVFISAIIVLPLLAWFASGAVLDVRLSALLATPSALAVGLNLLPEGQTEIARQWQTHLFWIVGLMLFMLLLTRVRLTSLLRKGVA